MSDTNSALFRPTNSNSQSMTKSNISSMILNTGCLYMHLAQTKLNESQHEKTGLSGFQPDMTQISLFSHKD